MFYNTMFETYSEITIVLYTAVLLFGKVFNPAFSLWYDYGDDMCTNVPSRCFAPNFYQTRSFSARILNHAHKGLLCAEHD